MRALSRPLSLAAFLALTLACGAENQGNRFQGLGDVAGTDIGFVLDASDASADAALDALDAPPEETRAEADVSQELADTTDPADAADTADAGPDSADLEALDVDAIGPDTADATGPCPHVTDTFHQVPGNKADVLFVVDGSGSMTEHVEALADDIGALAEAFTAHGTDFHLGAVGISATDDCATAGQLMGDPRILTAASWQGLHDIVVGAMDDECANSGTEAGLAAASLALSPALTAETSTVCTLDGQCGPGTACVDGLCGGPNRDFLRADASLHVLVISDEDDQSPATVQTYVNGFLGIKGTANPALFRFHAIVGKADQTGCPDGSYADPGVRYREAAALTDGKAGDICTNDFAGLLADIGDVGVAFKTAWTLSQAAAPSSVSVAIDGEACGGGYTYVQATHQVVVEPEGPCMPGPGQTIEVSYATVCAN